MCRRCTRIDKTVHTLEEKLRTAEDEALSLQNEVLRKKGEMARLMSSIQLARAQVEWVWSRDVNHAFLAPSVRLAQCTRDYDNQAAIQSIVAMTQR